MMRYERSQQARSGRARVLAPIALIACLAAATHVGLRAGDAAATNALQRAADTLPEAGSTMEPGVDVAGNGDVCVRIRDGRATNAACFDGSDNAVQVANFGGDLQGGNPSTVVFDPTGKVAGARTPRSGVVEAHHQALPDSAGTLLTVTGQPELLELLDGTGRVIAVVTPARSVLETQRAVDAAVDNDDAHDH